VPPKADRLDAKQDHRIDRAQKWGAQPTGAEPCLNESEFVDADFSSDMIESPSSLASPVKRGALRGGQLRSGAASGAIDSHPARSIAAGPWLPSQLRAVVLLGGAVRNSNFSTAIKRSLLDLPVAGQATLLDHWMQEVCQLCRWLKLPTMQVRLVIGRNCSAPRTPQTPPEIHLGVERDPMDFRGTGGVLRDLAMGYADHDLLLVANANQLTIEPLAQRVDRLLRGEGDVRILADAAQEPAGLFMLRCGCLRGISASGFVDLKEQALPSIAAGHAVRVMRGGHAVTAHSIRRWDDYLTALRWQNRPPGEVDAFAYQEDWQPLFSVVEKGAHVDSTASVHDSVVLAGGRVEARAAVVRSVVGPGGVVRRGRVVVGRLVTAAGETE
jgi:hypothetical protein